MQAVKNLLLLVQHQVAVEENENSEHSLLSQQQSSSSIPSSPHQEGELSQHSLEPQPSTPTSFPDLKEDPRSFDSEPSYDPSQPSAPVRASPIIGSKSQTKPFASPVSSLPAHASTFELDDLSENNGSSLDDNMDSSNHNSSTTGVPSGSNNQAMHAEMAARLAEG